MPPANNVWLGAAWKGNNTNLCTPYSDDFMKLIDGETCWGREEAARMLKIAACTMSNNIKKGTWPEPSKRIGKRWYLNQADIERYAALIAEYQKTKWQEQRTKIGLYTHQGARKKLGFTDRATWQLWTAKGIIPRPQHQHGCFKYYVESDLVELAKIIASRQAPENTVSPVDMAKSFGIKPAVLRWHIQRYLPTLGTKIGKRRYYDWRDVDTIRKYLESKKMIEPKPVIKFL